MSKVTKKELAELITGIDLVEKYLKDNHALLISEISEKSITLESFKCWLDIQIAYKFGMYKQGR